MAHIDNPVEWIRYGIGTGMIELEPAWDVEEPEEEIELDESDEDLM